MSELLSEREQEEVKKLLSNPLFFPPEFERYVREQISKNTGELPISQMLGARGIERYLTTNTTEVDVVNTAVETQVFSYGVKGKTIALAGQLRLFVAGVAKTPDATNQVFIRVKLGGTTFVQFALTQATLDGTYRPWAFQAVLRNKGSYVAQHGLALGSAANELGGNLTLTNNNEVAVDTSSDKNLTLTFAWDSGNANSSCKVQYVAASVFNPIGV